jgi:hypothetical protein
LNFQVLDVKSRLDMGEAKTSVSDPALIKYLQHQGDGRSSKHEP